MKFTDKFYIQVGPEVVTIKFQLAVLDHDRDVVTFVEVANVAMSRTDFADLLFVGQDCLAKQATIKKN